MIPLSFQTTTTSLQIGCIVKTDRHNPHERIHSVGGVANGSAWRRTQAQVIADIESRQRAYYVTGGGRTVKVIVATHNGHKYIKPENDGIHPDNLLALPSCR